MQILVVVANTKARRLRVEVEKGSTRTAIDRGLVDPKRQINFGKRAIGPVVSGGLRPSGGGSVREGRPPS